MTEGFSPIFLSLTRVENHRGCIAKCRLPFLTDVFVLSTGWCQRYKSSLCRRKWTRNKFSTQPVFLQSLKRLSPHPARMWVYLERVVFLCVICSYLDTGTSSL
ncbi:unnamed protein product [Ectocarpus sp. 13 AM-2016]